MNIFKPKWILLRRFFETNLITFLFACCFLAGCQKYYVSVVREKIDRDSLASTFVGTPDPLQENPPLGQKLYISWRLPANTNLETAYLRLSVILHNYETRVITFPVNRPRDLVVYSLMNEAYFETGGLLSYKAEINDGEKILANWVHSMWTEPIIPEEVD